MTHPLCILALTSAAAFSLAPTGQAQDNVGTGPVLADGTNPVDQRRVERLHVLTVAAHLIHDPAGNTIDVRVTGTAPAPGYVGPHLRVRHGGLITHDGYLELDLVAIPPRPDVSSPAASLVIDDREFPVPDGTIGVRVYQPETSVSQRVQ